MSDDLVKRLRNRKEPTIEVDIHWPQIVDSDTQDEECIEAADRIEELEFEVERLTKVTSSDADWLAAYHKWCEMNGFAPSSSDLIAAIRELEKKDE